MQSSQPRQDVVLFFDACMEKMQECGSNCRSNQAVLCRHRFNFNAQTIHTNGYIGFLRFSDFQIVLHCFYLIKKQKRFQQAAKNGRFFIITKDKKFLYDAEKVWREKKKAKTSPRLRFDSSDVHWDQWRIRVLTVPSKDGCDYEHDLAYIIETLNKIFPIV